MSSPRGITPRESAELSKSQQRVFQDAKKLRDEAASAAITLAKAQGKVGKEWNKKLTGPLTQALGDLHQALRAGDIARVESIRRELELQAKGNREQLEAMKNAYEEIYKKQKQSASQMVDSFTEGADEFRSVLSGGDFARAFVDQLTKGAGKLQLLGQARQGRAAQLSAMGDTKGAQGMAQMGQTLAKVGAAVATFAAVAGAVVLLVKLFMDLESKAKDMNKAILESASASDFGLGRADVLGGKLTNTLEQIRSETTAVNDNFLRFRLSAKDQQDTLAALNQAGYTYARMKKDIDDARNSVESFSDVTVLAVTYSRNLGLGVTEMAQAMGQYQMETGTGIEQIAQQFSVITREAAAAGVQTKRFYQAVSEASSGMAFYGVRIEETARLLSTFDSLLGEAVGTEAFKALVGQYQDKSAQDALQDFLVKGQEFTTEQFSRAYERQLQVLSRDFAGDLGGQNLEDILKGAKSETDLVKTLADMGISGEKRSQISNLFGLRQAATGNRAAQMAYKGAAGPGFDIAMAMKAALPLQQFGDNIGQVFEAAVSGQNEAALIALQDLSKHTGKSFDQIKQLSIESQATFERLQKAQLEGGEIPEDLKKLGFFIDAETKEIKRGVINAEGNIDKVGATLVEDVYDVLAATPTEGEAQLQEALTKDQQIAAAMSREITGLSDIMEQTVAAILNEIYDVIVMMADFMFKDDKERMAELQLQKSTKEHTERAQEEYQKVTEEVKALQAKLDAAPPEQKDALIKELDELYKKQVQAEEEVNRRKQAQEGSKNVAGKDILEQGAGTVLKDLLGEGAGGRRSKALDRTIRDTSVTEAPSGWLNAVARTLSPTMAMTQEAQFLAKGSSDIAAEIRAGLVESGLAEADIERIVAAAVKAADEAGASSTAWTATGRFAQQREAAIVAAQLEAGLKEPLLKIAENTETTSEFSWANLVTGMRKANDVIIPKSGPPIITDSADTIVASKPGGAIDRAGGRGGSVVLNINGGDQKEVYQTVLRALKESGLA
jgi:hypothetical protein